MKADEYPKGYLFPFDTRVMLHVVGLGQQIHFLYAYEGEREEVPWKSLPVTGMRL